MGITESNPGGLVWFFSPEGILFSSLCHLVLYRGIPVLRFNSAQLYLPCLTQEPRKERELVNCAMRGNFQPSELHQP